MFDGEALGELENSKFMSCNSSHPNLHRAFGWIPGWGPAGGIGVLTELMDGSLEDLQSTLDPNEKAIVLTGVANGLEYLHKQGLVHSGLKASNVLLRRRDAGFLDVKLELWNVRPASEEGVVHRRMLRHSAPELSATECAAFTVQTDVYAFGLLAYSLMTGREPFDGVAEEALQGAKMGIARTVKLPRVPLAPTLRECLRADPDDRPETMSQVLEAIGVSGFGFFQESVDVAHVRAAVARFEGAGVVESPAEQQEKRASLEREQMAAALAALEADLQRARGAAAEVARAQAGSGRDAQAGDGAQPGGSIGGDAADPAEVFYRCAITFRDEAHDAAGAARMFRDAADRGHARAKSEYARCLVDGTGTKIDFVAAAEYAEKADDALGRAVLSRVYRFGHPVKDAELAVRYAKESADAGDLYGLAEWGACLRDGFGVEKNEEEGTRLIRLSADGGCSWGFDEYAESLWERETGRSEGPCGRG
jgi:hypothetical protein